MSASIFNGRYTKTFFALSVFIIKKSRLFIVLSFTKLLDLLTFFSLSNELLRKSSFFEFCILLGFDIILKIFYGAIMGKFFLSMLIIAVFLAGCDSRESAKDMISVKNVITEVSLNTFNGKSIKATRSNDGFRFEGYEGKAVLLAFFATWCEPCRAEVPHLVLLNEKYKDKFSVLSVLIEKNKDKQELGSFVQNGKINYDIVLSPSNEEMAKAVGGVRGIPNMFLFASDGRMIAHYPGAVPAEMIEEDLKKAGVIK